jgi:hypothetical protein
LGNLTHEKEGTKRCDKNQDHHIGERKKIVGEDAALWGHAESAKQINEISRLEVRGIRKYAAIAVKNTRTARYMYMCLKFSKTAKKKPLARRFPYEFGVSCATNSEVAGVPDGLARWREARCQIGSHCIGNECDPQSGNRDEGREKQI